VWVVVVGVVLVLGFLVLKWDGRARPRPMAVWLERMFLDNPLRRALFPPEAAARAWPPAPGDTVAELGVGVGMITRRLAEAVGSNGQVWGVDCQPRAVDAARRRLAGLPCTIVVADARALPWPEASVSAVYSAAMLGELPAGDRKQVLTECARVLVPDGHLVLVEYGPDPHFLSPSYLTGLVGEAGFQVLNVQRGFWQYAVVARWRGRGQPANAHAPLAQRQQ
jgi:SAM-dependent methyltransferase